jgi:hypothetical protein
MATKYQSPPRKSSKFPAQQYDNTCRGALFRNTDKEKETDRDYAGTLNVDGTEYWASGWVRTSKAGAKYLSLSLKPKADLNLKPKAEPTKIDKPAFDDDIGF